MSELNSWLQGGYRQARRVAIAVVGFTVLAFGIVLLVTPGPAFVVIPIGLGILAIEFAWARRWLLKIKEKAQDAANRWNGKTSPAAESAHSDSKQNALADDSQADDSHLEPSSATGNESDVVQQNSSKLSSRVPETN